MKISDIAAVLEPTHNICIDKPPVNDSQAFYTRDALYIGRASDIPDRLKSADVVNISANDFRKLIVYIDERGVT